MKIAVVQQNSHEDKKANISKALHFIDEAASKGANLVVLPEYVDYMGDDTQKLRIAETIPGPTSEAFSKKAKEHGIYLNCGSMAEIADGKRVYNTSLLINDNGEIIAKYRKTHLYDADFKGRFSEKESDSIIPGYELVTAETPFGKVGLTICYDIRFPELYRSLALQGCKILFVPAAFPLYTGANHWEILLRARAIENQCYIVAAGQFGTAKPNRTLYGNSMIINPWGTVVARAPESEGIIIHDIDMEYLEKVRDNMHCFSHRRPDVYKL
ncbi:carbon-nitrogen hydrolase family protein [Neobacillus mesonae]|uniref:Hydrolase n=1 Tax=Neobacillus mesonae TaxID=1193713 RepID=A0A3Q9QV90_9BACI|nr:carbon-nitrogen hydrolase family protein [Neobacillus mesonae]AZU62545.1 hydrolase [Neobacillus mesonae]